MNTDPIGFQYSEQLIHHLSEITFRNDRKHRVGKTKIHSLGRQVCQRWNTIGQIFTVTFAKYINKCPGIIFKGQEKASFAQKIQHLVISSHIRRRKRTCIHQPGMRSTQCLRNHNGKQRIPWTKFKHFEIATDFQLWQGRIFIQNPSRLCMF